MAPMSRATAALALLLATAALLLAGAPPAEAHAVLERTSPADGESLADAPDEVTLTFSEPVTTQVGAVRVFDAQGRQVDAGDAGPVPGDATAVRVGLGDDLADGTYVATWNAVSLDGHPISGAFAFGVGAAGIADDRAIAALLERSSASDARFVVLADTLRVLVYGGTLLAVGAVLFLVRAHDGRGSERALLARVTRAAAGTGAAASLAGVPVQGALVTGLGAPALVDPGVVGDVLASGYGASALLRAAGLAVLAVALGRLPHRAALAGAGAGAALVAFVVTGHAASAEPRVLYVAADLVHAAAGAAWFGGLVLLLLTLRARRAQGDAPGAAAIVARFSRVATVAVLAVGAAGLVLAAVQVRAPRALVAGAYGWTLLGKVAVVAAVAALGAYNQRRLVPAVTGRRPRRAAAVRAAAPAMVTVPAAPPGAAAAAAASAAPPGAPGGPGPAAPAGPRPAPEAPRGGAAGRARPRRTRDDAWRALDRIVRWEVAGLAVAVALTAVLTTLLPARTAAGLDGPFSRYVALGPYELNVTVDPNRAGTNEYHFYLLGPDGRLTDDVSELALSLTHPAGPIGPIARTPDFVTPGHWTMTGDELSIPGEWQVEVGARVGEFDQVTVVVPITVNP